MLNHTLWQPLKEKNYKSSCSWLLLSLDFLRIGIMKKQWIPQHWPRRSIRKSIQNKRWSKGVSVPNFGSLKLDFILTLTVKHEKESFHRNTDFRSYSKAREGYRRQGHCSVDGSIWADILLLAAMMLLTVQGKYCMNGAASLFTCFGLKLIKIVEQEIKWDDLQKLLPTIMVATFLLY